MIEYSTNWSHLDFLLVSFKNKKSCWYLFYKLYQSNVFMYYVLSKDIIESEIICHLPERKHGLLIILQLVVGSLWVCSPQTNRSFTYNSKEKRAFRSQLSSNTTNLSFNTTFAYRSSGWLSNKSEFRPTYSDFLGFDAVCLSWYSVFLY